MTHYTIVVPWGPPIDVTDTDHHLDLCATIRKMYPGITGPARIGVLITRSDNDRRSSPIAVEMEVYL